MKKNILLILAFSAITNCAKAGKFPEENSNFEVSSPKVSNISKLDEQPPLIQKERVYKKMTGESFQVFVVRRNIINIIAEGQGERPPHALQKTFDFVTSAFEENRKNNAKNDQ